MIFVYVLARDWTVRPLHTSTNCIFRSPSIAIYRQPKTRSVDSTVLRGLVHGDVETFWVRFGGCLGGRLGLERTNERTQTTPEQPPHSGRRRARGRVVWGCSGVVWVRSFVRSNPQTTTQNNPQNGPKTSQHLRVPKPLIG